MKREGWIFEWKSLRGTCSLGLMAKGVAGIYNNIYW